MNQESTDQGIKLWVMVLISAGVALLISAVVTVILNIPLFLSQRSFDVPRVVGMSIEAAGDSVARKDLVIVPVGEEPSEFEAGVILTQDPEPGEKVRSGDVIKVIISQGTPLIQVPLVRGLDLSKATQVFQAAGLFVSDVISRHDTLAEDMVVGTEPPAGVFLEKGDRIKLIVSMGPQLAEVPKVTRTKLNQARAIIEENGFAVGEIRHQVTTEYYGGTVMKQSPNPGQMIPLGSEIDLVVAGELR